MSRPLTAADAAYIARVEALQQHARWDWRFVRESPEHVIALMGLLLDEQPYRSPHSDAGVIVMCAGVPAASCVAGGWVRDGQCCREAEYPPADADHDEHGMCALREDRQVALTAQVSKEAKAPALPRPRKDSERQVRDWLARLLPAALALGSDSVIRGAASYRTHDVTGSVADTRALADFAWGLTCATRIWEVAR